MKLSAVCISIVAALLCSEKLSAQTVSPPPMAKIFEVSDSSGDVTREFYGRVAARETVDLAFQVGGQIIEFPIVAGQPITAGSIVARLDTKPFEIARDQAKAQNEQATRTVDRLSRLSGSSVSQVTVDDARTQAELTAIALRDAERSLGNATLLAPFDALVATRNVANFTTVGMGTPVARLHDMSELHIEIDVPEVLFQRTGRDADVAVEAEFPGIKEHFPLEIREFNAETSGVGQTFRITFAMVPPNDHVILPGASVTVIATIRGAQAGLLIPSSSVVFAPDGTAQVMRFTPDDADPETGVVSVSPVTVAPTDDGEILVMTGLSTGDRIVASGAEQLRDGDRVRRFAGFAN